MSFGLRFSKSLGMAEEYRCDLAEWKQITGDDTVSPDYSSSPRRKLSGLFKNARVSS